MKYWKERIVPGHLHKGYVRTNTHTLSSHFFFLFLPGSIWKFAQARLPVSGSPLPFFFFLFCIRHWCLRLTYFIVRDLCLYFFIFSFKKRSKQNRYFSITSRVESGEWREMMMMMKMCWGGERVIRQMDIEKGGSSSSSRRSFKQNVELHSERWVFPFALCTLIKTLCRAEHMMMIFLFFFTTQEEEEEEEGGMEQEEGIPLCSSLLSLYIRDDQSHETSLLSCPWLLLLSLSSPPFFTFKLIFNDNQIIC